MDWIIPNWHPVLVHFTIALLGVSAVLAVVAVFIRSTEKRLQVTVVAEWNFWIGAAMTLLTLFAGWQAFGSVAHDEPAHRAMLDHRNWAVIAAAWTLVMAVWLLLRRHFEREPFNPVFAVAAAVLLGLLSATAWHGGELVYRHGLGVMSLPDTGRHEHGAHGHGDGGHAGKESHADDGHGGSTPSHAGERPEAGADSEDDSGHGHDHSGHAH